MTIKNALDNANKIFIENQIENYFYESRELLANIIHKTKEWIMSNLDYELEIEQEREFNEIINKRSNGMPFQYIVGYQYFMGNKFFVNKDVLIPRADTEILVYKVLEMANKIENIKIMDMCTGSGCIAISLAKKILNASVYAADISEDALNIAIENSKINETNIKFFQSDLFDNIPKEEFDIIVSNPPYISTLEIEKLQKDVKNEPHIALDGGEDGLKFYKKISKKALEYLKKGGYIAFEIGYDQSNAVSLILTELGYSEIEVIKDYSNNDRVVIAKK